MGDPPTVQGSAKAIEFFSKKKILSMVVSDRKIGCDRAENEPSNVRGLWRRVGTAVTNFPVQTLDPPAPRRTAL